MNSNWLSLLFFLRWNRNPFSTDKSGILSVSESESGCSTMLSSSLGTSSELSLAADSCLCLGPVLKQGKRSPLMYLWWDYFITQYHYHMGISITLHFITKCFEYIKIFHRKPQIWIPWKTTRDNVQYSINHGSSICQYIFSLFLNIRIFKEK